MAYERPLGWHPLWHGLVEDQWACIPYGTAWKTSGLVSPMAQLWEDQWVCIPYGTTWLKTVGLASLTGICVFNSMRVFYWVHYSVFAGFHNCFPNRLHNYFKEKCYMYLNFYKESLTNWCGAYSSEMIKKINKNKCYGYQWITFTSF
jgi:hypothetical protein